MYRSILISMHTVFASPSQTDNDRSTEAKLDQSIMDDAEAHAVFAAAMAASGFAVDSPVRQRQRNEPQQQQQQSGPATPRRRWAAAEEEWRRASQSQEDHNDEQESDYDKEEDDDSLFDDLKSIGSESKQTTTSRQSRPFLVEKEAGVMDSSDDDEDQVLPLKMILNRNSPALSAGIRSQSSSVKHRGNHARNSDSESTVATSNTRQSSVRTERAVVMSQTASISSSVNQYPLANNRYRQENDTDEDIEEVSGQFGNQPSKTQSSPSFRTPVNKLSPAKPTHFERGTQSAAMASSSKVKKVISTPKDSIQDFRNEMIAQKSSDNDEDNWANFDEGFSNKIALETKQTPSQRAMPLSNPSYESQTSTGTTKSIGNVRSGQNTDSRDIEDKESQEISTGMSRVRSEVVASGTTYESDYSDEVSMSSMEPNKSPLKKGSFTTHTEIPENSDVNCNTDVGWMLSAMGLGDTSNNHGTDQKGEENIQGCKPKDPVNEASSSLQPVPTETADTGDSLQAWLGYAADFLFPPLSQCGNTIETSNTETPEHQAAGLLELAQCAAQAAHEIEGIPYTQQEIDVCSEIHFSVIRAALPLGILFQENQAGCWVARIFASGNAAQLPKDSVVVGDQLAAIDGKSAMKKSVDDIRVMLSGGNMDSKNDVELTFLRYIGPIRPAPVISPTSIQSSSNTVPIPSPSNGSHLIESNEGDSSGAGQEIVVVSKSELKRSKSKSARQAKKGCPRETFSDESPAPLLVESKISKPKSPFAKFFNRKKTY